MNEGKERMVGLGLGFKMRSGEEKSKMPLLSEMRENQLFEGLRGVKS